MKTKSLVPQDTTSGRLCESGDRSKETGLRLWKAITSAYRQGHCFTDFWATYAAVIPEEQHTAVGKETGETAHVERWNNTLRQRLARFVRMTLSFSKSVVMLRPHVCFSFSIDIIWIRLSYSSEPLSSEDACLRQARSSGWSGRRWR